VGDYRDLTGWPLIGGAIGGIVYRLLFEEPVAQSGVTGDRAMGI
jgi:hypothetical protein